MREKILFLTTAHKYNDDRIFYHQAKELLKEGFQVKICSLSSEFVGNIEGIEIESYSILNHTAKEKIKVFQTINDAYQPDCIICSEPLAVIASKRYVKKNKASVLYDITEWYPSMRMVREFPFILKIFHGLKFLLIQLYAGFLSTHFIFGEKTKVFPLGFFFPLKKKIILPYYPDEGYIHENIKTLEPNKIKLCYTGVFSKEKGIENFFEVADCLQQKQPHLQVSILLIGGTRKQEDEVLFQNLLSKYNFQDTEIIKTVSFEEFTKAYSEADICFDLREINYENHHCLPIKIFYYAASGKPVIYSNLKATRKYVDVSDFGYLVNPKDADYISNLIIKYFENPSLYHQHSLSAQKKFKEKYNWNLIKNTFTNFIHQSIRDEK